MSVADQLQIQVRWFFDLVYSAGALLPLRGFNLLLTIKLLGILWLLLAVTACAAQSTDDPTPYPIRWTASLDLPNLQAIEQRLAQTWSETLRMWPGNRRSMSTGSEPLAVKDCLSYFRLSGQGYEARPYRSQLAQGVECHALKALAGAKSARLSYLDDFRLTEETPGLLPPDLSLALSDEEERKVASANAKGLSWRDYQPLTASPQGATALRVEGNGWGMRLSLYAWADFDGDGVEDILVKSQGWLNEGSYQTTRLLTLTRLAPGERFRLVKEYDLSGR